MSLTLFLAYLMDECLGEPKRFHPLIGFGWIVNSVEKYLYSSNKYFGRFNGFIAWCVAVLPFVFAIHFFISSLPSIWQFIVNGIVLYFTLGQNSLKHHGLAVMKPLLAGNINEARRATSMIVSRDTSDSNEQQLATASVETITENTHDAVIAPLFYFMVFGAAGALLFRLSNTLDAMWGYRNEKYENYGKFSARMDDCLGFIPARLTALLFICARPLKTKSIVNNVWSYGRKWYSPNAGIVMAAGAGAINVRLGGNAIYHGKEKLRQSLGNGSYPNANGIKDGIKLMYQASIVFLLLVMIGEFILLKGNWAGLLP